MTDNGIGFDSEHFDAFLNLDTEHKVAKGRRGIGRLPWLKASLEPVITIEDDAEQLRLHEVSEQHMHSSAVRQQVRLKDRPFDLLHVKLRTSAATEHAIAYCANNRLVLEEKLEGRVPGLHGSLDDTDGEFVYLCYVSSNSPR